MAIRKSHRWALSFVDRWKALSHVWPRPRGVYLRRKAVARIERAAERFGVTTSPPCAHRRSRVLQYGER